MIVAWTLAVGADPCLAASAEPPGATPEEADIAALAHRACEGCHAFPPPETVPRDRWRDLVHTMTGLLMSGIGAPPDAELEYDYDVDRLGHYFESRAPASFPPPEPWPAPDPAPRLQSIALGFPGGPERPAVANVRFADLDGDGAPEVVACDMNHGVVLVGDPREPGEGLSILARVPNPAHASVVDLDGDGRRDLLVADLGSIPPGDHENGSVVWLRRRADGAYEPRTLISGLPRVADVEAVDLDGDGDLDLVVAAFGWRAVGATLLYENTGGPAGDPSFVRIAEDPRAGAIHVPTADVDGDGRMDVVVLLAQQHERVELMLNRGERRFERRTLYEAPHPAWGSSGIDLADMDRDGDLDVVLAAGDMLDDYLLKPWHGIQWLENRGDFPFAAHPVASLGGVHRAIATDLDGDGDLDIAACSFVQRGSSGTEDLVSDLPSLVWLEQLPGGRFGRHTLEVGGQHVTLDAADYDGDGDPDLVTGSFRTPNETWVEVWENGE